MYRRITTWLMSLALLCVLGLSQAQAFTHPCIPNTLEELDTIKANLDKQPWKQGYAVLAGDSKSQLNYTMRGPFASVSRAPYLNLNEWRSDMVAVYNLSRMWYFTGNEAYAQKARDILIAWANTHTYFGAWEAALELGDYAVCYGGGASILRGTWPGWTEADTTTVKNYFLNTLWPAALIGGDVIGPANKGALYMAGGISIAAFCDDTAKFDHIINHYRTFHGSGLMNTLPTGQMGESGRDAGHAFGTLNGMTFVAEVAWKQGIDLYSELDNRLLAVGEYYARNTFTTDNPYVPFGTIDWQWMNNGYGPYTANRGAFYLLQNAYKNRKGLATPWIDRKLQEQSVDGGNFMFAKTADFSTATVSPASFPAVSPASSGLTLTTLGTQTSGRSATYANGVWTMTGLGNGVWSDTTDDCQFAYTTMTGDCAMIAKVTSNQYPNAEAKAGLMIRDNLTATIGQRGWIGVVSAPTTRIDSHMRGWTDSWGGGGYAQRQHDWPPGIPYWIKIERRGKHLSTFASPDGTSWSVMNSSYYGDLPSTLYLGLFVCSGTTTTNTATFENVAFTGGTGGLVTTPAAPVGVLASGSAKAISVRWLASFGATAYDLLRSTTSGSGYTVIASDLTADKTSYMDTNVSTGTTYYYVVRAKNSAGTSGDSPEFSAALPTPMANLAFNGTATASINTGSQVGGSDDAFNGDPGSKWFGYSSPTGWLQYDFGSGNAQVVKRYTINCADVDTRDPKSWNLLGSQDGTNWTTLDSQSNQSFVIRMGMNTYDIANTTAYRYYRIDITANNGATGVAIGDLGLWGDAGRTLPDGTYVLVSRNSNKVMDVTSNTDGSPVVQRSFTGDDSQQWNIEWQGNGQYRATNIASTKVLDNGGTSSTGANLVIQPSSGNDSQLWTITPDSDGFFRVTSANSGLAVDVSGGSTADDANIVQETYTGSDSQLWMPGLAVEPQPIPPTPTGLAVTPVSIYQIDLSWLATPGAVRYNIKRATVSGGPYTTVAAGVNTWNYTDTNLTAGTTYYYVVSAINGSGESANSAQASATTPADAPDAPTDLTSVLGHNQATLSWTAVGGATSYTVKRSTTIGGPYTTVASGLTSATYTDTGLTNDVTYYYIVVADNAYGSSPGSAELATTPSTLVAHLKFDETGGNIAADSSGRDFHATLVNAPGFAAGTFGNALDFPATANQHATLPNGVVSGLTDFTISTWIKVNAFATWQRIFDLGTGTNNYMYLTTQYTGTAPNNAKLRFGTRTATASEEVVSGTGIALTAGTWNHVAVTRSGNTLSLYVDGSLAGSGTVTISPDDLGVTTLNYLGRSQWSDPYLNAALDDFRIYSDAKSASEIAAMANPPAGAPMQFTASPGDTQTTLTWLPNATTTYTVKRSTTSGGPYTTIATGLTDLIYTDTGLTNGVTYYYVVSGANAQGSGPDSEEMSITPTSLRLDLRFDETGGTIAFDSGDFAANAALINGPAFTGGRIGNALILDAASSQHATLPDGIVSDLSDFTVATWIKVNSFATWQRIFDFGTATNNYMNLTAQGPAGAGRPRFAIRTSSVAEQKIDSSIALTAGTWNHVAVTRSGNTVSIYVDGSLAGSGTITSSPADLGTTTKNYLGKSQFSDPYLNATLDGFRIYSLALSASEVSALATLQSAPSGLTATGGIGQVSLSWDAVSGATSYNVKRSATSGGPYATLQNNVTSTNFTDVNVASGTTYHYVVSATHPASESPNSNEASATTAPDAPTGLTTIPGSGQVDLSWNASTGTSSYTILRATAPNGPFTTLATGVTGTSYADTSALPGWTYYYAVSAGNGAGESQASASATTTGAAVAISWLKLDETNGTTAADASGNTNAGTLVNSPAWIGGKAGNALALNGSNQYATLPNDVISNLHDFTVATWVYWNGGGNWQRIFDFGSGTSNYLFLSPKNGANGKLRFAIKNGGGEQIIDGNAVLPSGGWHHVAVTLSGTTGTLYVDGLQVGQNTGITLRPSDLGATTQNRIGRSQFNDPYFNGRLDDFRLYAGALSAADIAALAAPIQTTGLAASGGTGQIGLTWNATTGATSYTVRRASTTGGAYTTVASGVTDTSYTDTGLADGTTYYYVVTPADASGDGANSTEVSALTIPAAPQNVIASSSGGEVSLGWDASTGASGYDVLRATSPGGAYTTIATGVTGTSYVDTTALAGTTYYYAIAATNGSGSSASSTEVNALTAPAAPTGLAATPDNAQVSLLWNASTGAATYDVLRSTTSGSGYTSVATGLTGTSYIDTGLTNDTAYYYVVTATNTGGTSANSNEATSTPVALPSPWATSDIGTTGATGSASRSPSGVFTVTGAGADIWGSSDAFRYVYQTATGDCDITARVVTLQNTHNAAKAGVMIRESLTANSRHAMTNLTAVNGLEFLRRTSTSGSTSGVSVSGLSAPYWVRLVRSGDNFTSYRSSDGVNWTSVGSVTISMSTNVQIGLLVCSHVNGTLCTSTFDNVMVTP